MRDLWEPVNPLPQVGTGFVGESDMNRIINIIGVCLLAMAGALLTLSEIALAQTGAGQVLTRDGVSITFDLKPLASDGQLREGEFADVQFRVTDGASGQPLSGVAPGAWIDPQAVARLDEADMVGQLGEIGRCRHCARHLALHRLEILAILGG